MEALGRADERSGGSPGRRTLLPALWVGVTMVLGLRSLAQSWPLLGDHHLPGDVATWLRFGIVIAIVNLAWGAWLLALAYRRAPSFPGVFTLWQVANIAAILVSAAYTSLSGSFIPQALTLAMMAAEVGVGIVLIAFVRRPVPAPSAPAGAAAAVAPAARSSPLAQVASAVLGAVLGGVALMFAGFFAGVVIADVADISCFEGGCGYFAVGIGLVGLVLGMPAGGIAAVWLTRRRARGGLA